MKKYFLFFISGVLNVFILSFFYGLFFSYLGALAELLIGYFFYPIIGFILIEFCAIFYLLYKLFKLWLEVKSKKIIFEYLIIFFLGHLVTIFLINPYIIGPMRNGGFVKKVTDKELLAQAVSQKYDFSTSTLFRNNSFKKLKIRLNGTKIAWFEETHESIDEYDKNGEFKKEVSNLGNDLFLFEFDPNTSIGTTTQITKTDGIHYVEATPISFFNGKIYWSSRNDEAEDVLEEYDPLTKKKRVVPSKEFNEEKVIDLSNITEITTLNYLSTTTSWTSYLFNSENKNSICYIRGSKQIGRYDISTGLDKLLVEKPLFTKPKPPEKEQQNNRLHLLNCNDKYVIYSYQGETFGENGITLYVYDLGLKKEVLQKNIVSKSSKYYLPSSLENLISTKLKGGYLYYIPYQEDGSTIYKVDFSSGKENIVFSTKGRIADWSADTGYVVVTDSFLDLISKENRRDVPRPITLERFNP